MGRLETVFDASYPAWRERQVWGRRMVVEGRTGALDPPGIPWRDRPQPNRSAGIFVVGDMMAAPGMLSEVALSSALEASAAALTWNVGQSDSPRRSPTSEVGSQ